MMLRTFDEIVLNFNSFWYLLQWRNVQSDVIHDEFSPSFTSFSLSTIISPFQEG